MYLLVSIDMGPVAAVVEDPSTDPAIRRAMDIGLIDVIRACDLMQLGFDGEWHPVERMTATAYLALLPSPVMSRLPHE